MAGRYLLEISVDGLDKALAAERGGADRIELCADLSVGGLTPTQEVLCGVRKKVRIPIFSMVRPRAGKNRDANFLTYASLFFPWFGRARETSFILARNLRT